MRGDLRNERPGRKHVPAAARVADVRHHVHGGEVRCCRCKDGRRSNDRPSQWRRRARRRPSAENDPISAAERRLRTGPAALAESWQPSAVPEYLADEKIVDFWKSLRIHTLSTSALCRNYRNR